MRRAPLRRWLSRTGSACRAPPAPGISRGVARERAPRVSRSGPSRARRGDDDARLETRECESGAGVDGARSRGMGRTRSVTPSGPPPSSRKRAASNAGKLRTFDRSRVAPPRSRVRRDCIAALRPGARDRAREREPALARIGSARRLARARPAPGGALKSTIAFGRGAEHLANDQVEGSDGARTGRVKTWGSSGRGGFGRCGVLREFVRARWVRACVRVAWSDARRPRPRPAVVAKKISRFLYGVFALAHGKQSFGQNFEKPSRNLFIFGNFGGGLADREKANQRPFDRVSVGFHRSSASLVRANSSDLVSREDLQRILMIAFFAR